MELLHTDNELDIPSLCLDWQATEVTAPVVGWGSLARDRVMLGTYHLYVADSKFSRLLQSPEQLLVSGCAVACEANASIYDQTPRYEALAAIGRKRAAAAHWGRKGVKLLVDLNVPWRFLVDNLLGVPRGWGAYSTRAYHARLDDLVIEYETARDHAGRDPLLLVIGGGEGAREACMRLPGAVYVAK
jgi:hypothetical protein